MKEGELGNMSNMRENAEGVKTFVAEVMTHGADLKFLTISGQKFIDISKVINTSFLLFFNLNKISFNRFLTKVQDCSLTKQDLGGIHK